MQVPTRRGDNLPKQKPDPYLTEKKFQDLKNKLERLKNVSRPREAAEVKRLAEMGDFSENVGYQIAKGRLRGINQRIIDLEKHLNSAIIISADPNVSAIQIGSRVILEKDGKQKTYTILGSTESDPARGVISYQSPLGAALMGHGAGETVSLVLGGKEAEYLIIGVGQG